MIFWNDRGEGSVYALMPDYDGQTSAKQTQAAI